MMLPGGVSVYHNGFQSSPPPKERCNTTPSTTFRL